MKKYISPGSWFSLEYPADWNEFEDTEDTFLFYNSSRWNGNFRISATKGKADSYGTDCLRAELKENPSAVISRIGEIPCAYSLETFQENGSVYTTYFWVLDYGAMCMECSFTTTKNGEKIIAETIINTICVPLAEHGFRHEIIPIRILEIGVVNTAYSWIEKTIKKELSKDFTGEEKDIAKIQQVMDSGKLDIHQKEIRYHLAIAFASIIAKNTEGMEWKTYVDGASEYPVLQFMDSEWIIHPADLVSENWPIDLTKIYRRIRLQASKMNGM